MSLQTRVRQWGVRLARRGWFGSRSSPLHRWARAIDRGVRASTDPSGRGRVAGVWNALASTTWVAERDRLSWTSLAPIHRHHNAAITGDPDRYWVTGLCERFFPDGDAGDVLSLGCGAGHLDRIFARCGLTMRSLTGLDISPVATATAQQLGNEMTLAPAVRYVAVDLNVHLLEPGRYDFIYWFQSLHHIEALEHALDQCHEALTPNGVLLVNEYVGPSRFQWTDLQMQYANELLLSLPIELRRDLTTGTLKREVVRPSVAEMLADDPSEAVRSGEIEGALKARFNIVGEWSWGGTVTHLLFQNIAGNFDNGNADHLALVERCIADEAALIREGVLPSDFKVFVAQRKDSRATAAV